MLGSDHSRQAAADEAVVQVSYAGICGTDVELFVNEHFHHYKTGHARLPIIPGHEWTGVVVEVGSDVKHLKKGTRVVAEVSIGCGVCRFCKMGHANVCRARREVGIINQNGGFAQFACIPASNLRPALDLAPEIAVAAEPTAVALHGCQRVNVSAGDRVLVVGAGPIGLLSLQCAKACGAAFVAILDRDQKRLELARTLGADAVLNSSSVGVAELPDLANSLTHGDGFDVVLECAGAAKVFEHLLKTLAPLGRIAVVGCFGDHHPTFNPDALIAGENTIAGSVGGGANYGDAIELLRSGKVRPAPIITHTFPLAEAPKLFGALALGQAPQGSLKVLLNPA